MPDHLELPFISANINRPIHSGYGVTRTQRTTDEKKDFFISTEEKFDEFQSLQLEKRIKYSGYFDPQLIFKIEVREKEYEPSFRDELRKSNIQVLSPSPDKTGYWVAFSEEEDLHTFRSRIDRYAREVNKLDILNAITGFNLIPKDEKIGNRLRKFLFHNDEKTYIDVEIWRMPDNEVSQFISGIERLVQAKGCRLTDKLIKKNFCLLRVHANQEVLDLLLDCDEVSFAELPSKPYIDYGYLNQAFDNLSVINELSEQSAVIAILDSGIVSNHPLFQGAVADEIPDINGVISDDTGHGSNVAGISLYGDIKKCIDDKQFMQSIWIISAKIMFDDGQGNPQYDPEKLLEHQLQDVVSDIRSNYSNCRIFNLSLGNQDEKVFELRNQYNLAILLDELSKEFDVIFTVATGNIPLNEINLDDYPTYFLENIPDFKILNPSSAALAITVGSIAHEVAPLESNPGDLFFAPASFNHPSPFTCSGPGFKGMIKPELVEYGGNFINNRFTINNFAARVLSINKDFVSAGKLFNANYGTSMSCPKVAHQLAQLINHYPEKGNNMIKALLLSSAKIPIEHAQIFNKITKYSSEKDCSPILNLYGFGLPSLDEALESENNNVLLIHENKIGLNKIHLYKINLPDNLFDVRGKRIISTTLVFDPPVNKNRIEYLACSMGFTLFKNTPIEKIIDAYQEVQIENGVNIDDIENKIPLPQIKFQPGTSLRNKGVHQKGTTYFNRLSWNREHPLVLAIVCQNKHIRDESYLQDYAVVVKIYHENNPELYTQLKLRNMVRVQVRS